MDRPKRVEDPFIAIRSGNIEHMQELIRSGSIDIKHTRWSGFTLLHRAAEIGHSDLCELLVDAGLDINTRTARGWFTPLHIALGNGYTDLAERLIHRGANPWLHNKQRQDPFEYGARKGYKKLCEEFRVKVVKAFMEKDLQRHMASNDHCIDDVPSSAQETCSDADNFILS